MLKTLTYRILILVIACLIFLGAVGSIWIGEFVFSPHSLNSTTSHKKILSITRGSSRSKITQLLLDEGIISNSQKFIFLGILLQKWKNVKAGDYEFSSSQTPLEVFNTLTSGLSVSYQVTFPEGSNIFQIADILGETFPDKKNEFLSLVQSKKFIASLGLDQPSLNSLEGYLHPDTYNVERSLPTRDLIKLMWQKQNEYWSEEYSNQSKNLGFSKHQVLTLASMIEKETGAKHERKTISGVFHNRLKKKMRLQSDPTTIYGIWHRYNGNIKRSDLREMTPYNTYTINGLPIGPIACPGAEAIHAALYPEQNSYLYFVSRNDGTHIFSSSLIEHNNAVKKTQLDPAARKGRSWRDLHKNQKN